MLKWIVATEPARRKHNRSVLDISWRVFLHELDVATAMEWKVIRLINWKSLRSCHSLLCQCWSCTGPGSFCSAKTNKEYLMKKGDWRRVELFEEFCTIMCNFAISSQCIFYISRSSRHLPNFNSLIFHIMPEVSFF